MKFNQETDYSSYLLKQFNRSKNGLFFKLPPILKGFPDIFGTFEGQTIFIEIKYNQGAIRQNQLKYLDNIYKVGGMALILQGFENNNGHWTVIHKWPVFSPSVIIKTELIKDFKKIISASISLNNHLSTNPRKVKLFDELLHTNASLRLNLPKQIVYHLNTEYSIKYL